MHAYNNTLSKNKNARYLLYMQHTHKAIMYIKNEISRDSEVIEHAEIWPSS